MPCNKTEVKSFFFLGLINYYRKFIPICSAVIGPITELTKKKIKFIWSQDCQKAFDSLKKVLVNPPILVFPRSEGLFILDTDGLQSGIGAVLS